MLTLKSVGEVIVKIINAVVTKFEGTVLKRIEPKQVQTKSAVILFSFVVILMIVNVQFLPLYYQDWTFVEGIYFWFITCTTVGFGDYVAVDYQPQRVKKLFLNTSINYSSNDISFEAGEPTATKFFEQLLYTLLSIVDLFTVSGARLCTNGTATLSTLDVFREKISTK